MTVIPKPHTIVKGRRNSQGHFYLGDCLDVFKNIEPHSVDVIVTSPPYNLGIRYNTYEDSLSGADYLEWTSAWIGAATRVLKPSGSLFLNVGSRPSDPWTALDVAQAGRSHLRLQNIIHWVKSIAIERESTGAGAGLTRDLAVGHYKPINSDRFLNDCHEFIFHFTPNGETRLDRLALGVPYQDQSNVTRWRSAGEGIRCRGNTWFIPYETIQRRDRDRPHPATFPSRLPEQCLRLHGLTGIDRVMDPFTGLGSTAVACARLGLNFVGADVDETYLTEAAIRMQAATVSQLPARGQAKMKKATSSAAAGRPSAEAAPASGRRSSAAV